MGRDRELQEALRSKHENIHEENVFSIDFWHFNFQMELGNQQVLLEAAK